MFFEMVLSRPWRRWESIENGQGFHLTFSLNRSILNVVLKHTG